MPALFLNNALYDKIISLSFSLQNTYIGTGEREQAGDEVKGEDEVEQFLCKVVKCVYFFLLDV